MNTCDRCRASVSSSNLIINRILKNKPLSLCKKCNKEFNREHFAAIEFTRLGKVGRDRNMRHLHYVKHANKIKARSRTYREKNYENLRVLGREYYYNNRGRILEKTRKNYAEKKAEEFYFAGLSLALGETK